MKKNYDMIVPALPNDVNKITQNIDTYFLFLPIKKIIIIGNETVKNILPKDIRFSFINENRFIDISTICNQICELTGKKVDGQRAGWYAQQFIKLSYSRVCSDEYYLLWDSDTVPVRKINFFDVKGLPYLDCKTEYHQPYFETIEKLLPGYKKQIKGSFIAEHMLVNTEYMKNMLAMIESNKTLKGNNFSEKIINSINLHDLPHSGFSEFETFGTYICKKYPDKYTIRKWYSLRSGGFFFEGTETIHEQNLKWLAKKYDAISFEKGNYLSSLAKMTNTTFFRRYFHANSLEYIAFFIKIFRKILKH